MEWVGRLIDGRYVVESLIGSGGMGVVLSARHKFTGARVALKMVRKDLGIDAAIESRFLAEARVPAQIDHRGIVKTLDAGKTPEGELYLVMELLAGRSLRAEIMRGVGVPSARRIGMELLDVLAAAHGRGIVHRDLKPENVFLVDPAASVKLLDFGITKVLAGATSALPRTQAGVVLGTLAYMAPEQLVDASKVNARADLWAVGIILYEMLAGRRPYDANTVEDMFVALIKSDPIPIRAVMPSATSDIEAFFARALAREPTARFATASEMAQAYAKLPLVSSSPVIAASPSGGLATMATGYADSAHVPPSPQTPPGGTPAVTPSKGTVAGPLGLAQRSPGPATPPAGTPHYRVGAPPIAPAYTPGGGTPNAPSTPGAGTPRAQGGTPSAPYTPYAGAPAAPGYATPPAGTPAAPGYATPPAGTPGLTPYGGTPAYGESPSGPLPPARSSGASTGSAMYGSASSTEEVRVPGRSSPILIVLGGIAAVALGVGVVYFSGVGRNKTQPPKPAPQGSAVVVATGSATSQGSATPQGSATQVVTPPTKPSGTGSGSAISRDVPTPTPKHRPPTPDKATGSATDTAPIDPYAGSAAPQPVDMCVAGCKMLAACHLGSSTCERDCAQGGAVRTCIQAARGDCNHFAACWFSATCSGIVPSGTHSCGEATDCEANCRGDGVCMCGCIGGVAFSHAALLLDYNGCALGCRNSGPDCMTKRCAGEIRRCRGN